MKFTFGFLFVLTSLISTSFGQALFVVNTFDDTHSHQQDSTVVITSLGATFEGETIQDSILVITDFILPTFMDTVTTFTHDMAKLEGIQLYPNPVPDVLVMHRDQWNEDYHVEIFQSNGQSIRKMKWDAGIENLQMSCGNFAQGVYFISVTNHDVNKSNTFKFMKK